MSKFNKVSALAGAAAAGLTMSMNCPAGDAGGNSSERPNLVYIFSDEHRPHALGFMKQDPVITPNLDRFAGQSLVFTNAISNHPLCSPYRASLFTGLYPHKTGVPVNCHSSRPDVALRGDVPCLSDILTASGYSCGYIGKWHLEAPHKPYVNGEKSCYDEYCPPERRRGFSFFYQGEGPYFNGRYWKNDAPREKPDIVKKWCAEHETDVAIDYLKNKDGKFRDPGKPFMLMMSWRPPHSPFQVPEKYLKFYKDKSIKDLLLRPNVVFSDKTYVKHAREYFAMITGIDDQFGRIMKALKEQGLDKNTIVVFSADHGEMIGSHGYVGKNRIYNESLRIPFIIRWPEHIKPGKDDIIFSVPDIMPTLLGLMGLKNKIPKSIHGDNYSRIILGGEQPRPDSALYMHCYTKWQRGLFTGRYTYQITYDGKEMLFDNQEDPYQMKNIASEKPEICDRMLVKIREHQKKIDDNKELKPLRK